MKNHIKNHRGKKRFLSVLLMAAVLILTVQGTYAAKNKATTIKLARTEGEVTIKNSSKGELSQSKDMRLYSGDHQITDEESYAWMSLDDSKAVKLDEDSESELRKKGRKLEVLLDSGNLFFNVSVPLEKDESLNIRTSSMVTGVRGTSGWFEVTGDWSTRVYLLTGSLECVVTNPTDNHSETIKIKPGTYADFYVFPISGEADEQKKNNESCRIDSAQFGKDAIPGFVLTELVGDSDLIQKIYDESGIDLRGLTASEADARLAQDQKAHAQKKTQIEKDGEKELNVVSKKPVWVVDGNPGDKSAVVWLTMPQTAETVQSYLNGSNVKKVILLPGSGNRASNTLSVDVAFEVPQNTVLEAQKNVFVEIEQGFGFTVNGTADLGDEVTNLGRMVVNSSNTLRLEETFINKGTFENTATGRVVLYKGMENGGQFINAGIIETAEGTFGDALIKMDGGSFTMAGGSIISGQYDAILQVAAGASVNLELSGGVIANEKAEGVAILVNAQSFQVTSLGTDVAGVSDVLLGKDADLSDYGAASVYRLDEKYHLVALDQVESYPILLSDAITHGSVVLPGRVEVGAKVILTPVADAGYRLESMTLNYYNGTGKPLGEAVPLAGDYSFVMPAHDLIVSAKFVGGEDVPNEEQKYGISVISSDGGRIQTDATEAVAGAEILVNVISSPGWEFETLSITAENGETVGLRQKGNGYAFTMPASAVSLAALFRAERYEVKFFDEDGKTVLYQTTLGSGEVPAYKGVSPTKKSTDKQQFSFTGWKNGNDVYPDGTSLPKVTANVTYVAVYEAKEITGGSVTVPENKYVVNWVNWDGSVLKTDRNVAGGTVPKYSGSTPSRGSDNEYNYSFSGWKTGDRSFGVNDALPAVTGDVTFMATYSASGKGYVITWKNSDGTVLQTQTGVTYGTVPAYGAELPTKKGDAQYSYAFSGWTPAVVSVTSDATYTATYSTTINRYTISWRDESGAELGTSTHAFGEIPRFNTTPTKAPDSGYSYSFKGWSNGSQVYAGELPAVTGNATYTATYEGTPRQYVVTWLNEDGSSLGSNVVSYDSVPSFGGTYPGKAETAQYTYSVGGWKNGASTYPSGTSLPKVTGNVTYTLYFNSVIRKYNVTWQNADGTTLRTDNVDYGTVPSYGANPAMTSAQYNFTFTGWSPAVTAVTGNATYVAQYSQSVKTYTVTWLNEDGSTIKADTLSYGSVPAYPGAPSKADTVEYDFVFVGWSCNGITYNDKMTPPTIQGDVTFKATFNAMKKQYLIQFVDETGSPMDARYVEYGANPVYGNAAPTKSPTVDKVFVFSGWERGGISYSGTLPAVTGEATYKVVFTSQPRKYTFTFMDGNDNVIHSMQLEYNTESTPSYNGPAPTKRATAKYEYAFNDHWMCDGISSHAFTSASLPIVDGDKVLRAQFDQTARLYTVRWLDEQGNLIDVSTYEYGQEPYHASIPKAADAIADYYTFYYWMDENGRPCNGQHMPSVEKDTYFKASYTIVYHNYVVSFSDSRTGSCGETRSAHYGDGCAQYKTNDPVSTYYNPDDNTTYVFKGWRLSSGELYSSDSLPDVTGDMYFAAEYEPQ